MADNPELGPRSYEDIRFPPMSPALIEAGEAAMQRLMGSRFLVLFPGRTGSTYLVSALQKHPQIHILGEPFGQPRPRKIDYVHQLYTSYPNKAVGFTTKLYQVSRPKMFAKMLRSYQVKIILMERENRVKWAISVERGRRLAEKSGRWNVFKGEPLPPQKIGPARIEKLLGEAEKYHCDQRAFVEELKLPILELTYEGLLDDHNGTLDQITNFIGVPNHHPKGNTKKNTPDDLRVAVTNYDELLIYFQGTKYARMFGEETSTIKAEQDV